MGLLRYFLLSIAMSQYSIASENIPDQYPQSVLYSNLLNLSQMCFSIGATAPPTYENGHNNNLSFVITADGVVVINSGASFSLAEARITRLKQ